MTPSEREIFSCIAKSKEEGDIFARISKQIDRSEPTPPSNPVV